MTQLIKVWLRMHMDNARNSDILLDIRIEALFVSSAVFCPLSFSVLFEREAEEYEDVIREKKNRTHVIDHISFYEVSLCKSKSFENIGS